MSDWSDDDALMAALAEAVAEVGADDDAVTDRRRAAAQAAFTWRTVDAELMDLLHDSSIEAGAAVRSAGTTARILSFGRGGFTLELELGADVLGQVVPGGRATVVVQRPDAQPVGAETDDSGFFRLDGLVPGLARFVVTASGRTLTTPWLHV